MSYGESYIMNINVSNSEAEIITEQCSNCLLLYTKICTHPCPYTLVYFRVWVCLSWFELAPMKGNPNTGNKDILDTGVLLTLCFSLSSFSTA